MSVARLPAARAAATPARQWATGIFGCFDGPDVGFNCAVQQCCCLPCIWGNALRRAGIQNSEVYFLAALCGGDTLIDEGASFLARRRLVEKYGITESSFASFFYSCCCNPCSMCQEINTVMKDKNLKYGCATLAEVPPAPTSTRMRRT